MTGDALLHGDNLALLRAEVETASVDLVYLDPPFNSQRLYRTAIRQKKTRVEVDAFDDSWAWNDEASRAFAELTASPGPVASFLTAVEALAGEGDRLAYLTMMAPRVAELHRVLKPTGSLYLHCDPGVSAYLRLLLDAVFGADCFRNEVVWRYRRWPAKAARFQRMHDVLLFYGKEPEGHVFNTLYGYEQLAKSTLQTFGTKKQLADFSSGKRKPSVEESESKGPPLSDVWEVSVIAPIGKERVGYPTQKPEALLERVILASSNPGDLVLDPFAGSGTTLAVAQRLGRRYLGMDASPVAIELARKRLGVTLSLFPSPTP